MCARACVHSPNLSGASNHLLKRMVILEKNIQLLLKVEWSIAGPMCEGVEGKILTRYKRLDESTA